MRRLARLAPTLIAAALPALAAAHEGHGAAGGAHWHASDAWGFVAVAAIAAALWFTRRK